MTEEAKKDFTRRITQANQSGLTVILYEMYLVCLDDAEKAGEDLQAFRDALSRARGCINEMMNSLDFRYDPAASLLQLYMYVIGEMAKADSRGSKEPLQICKKIITELLSAYREVSRQDTSPAMMENTQTVYAGLTYGKGELTESLSHQGNRGFLV